MRLAALGTDVEVRGDGEEAAAAEVVRLEAILTRFAPSPLTRLNESGRLRDPPRELVAAVRHALAVARATGGLVTPTVLPALERAGYRRPWPHASPPADATPRPCPPVDGIVAGRETLTLPPGVRLDLGGTAKTWIARRAARQLGGDVVVDAGGDVHLDRGVPSLVEVAHPAGGEPLALWLGPGRWGVATSSVASRSWPGGHHLIDPRTGAPAVTRWVQVTAVARSVTWAEVAAKLALFGVRPARVALLVAFDGDGAAWTDDGRGWSAHGARRDASVA